MPQYGLELSDNLNVWPASLIDIHIREFPKIAKASLMKGKAILPFVLYC